MTLFLIFFVISMALAVVQIEGYRFLKFYKNYDYGNWQLRMPSEPQVTHLEQLWEARKNN